jgi:hypothetical protein
VQGILDKDVVAVNRNDGQTTTKDWKEGIFAHSDLKVGHQLVGNEGRLVREHMISRAQICDSEMMTQAWKNRGCQHSFDVSGEIL